MTLMRLCGETLKQYQARTGDARAATGSRNSRPVGAAREAYRRSVPWGAEVSDKDLRGVRPQPGETVLGGGGARTVAPDPESGVPQTPLEPVPRGCMDCIMAYLLFGDGAVCLAGHGRIYWKGKGDSDDRA